jgi:hypothetical protein
MTGRPVGEGFVVGLREKGYEAKRVNLPLAEEGFLAASPCGRPCGVSSMGEARWKRHERQVARALGGERLPNTGRRGPDALAGPWAIEVKTRRPLPQVAPCGA